MVPDEAHAAIRQSTFILHSRVINTIIKNCLLVWIGNVVDSFMTIQCDSGDCRLSNVQPSTHMASEFGSL